MWELSSQDQSTTGNDRRSAVDQGEVMQGDRVPFSTEGHLCDCCAPCSGFCRCGNRNPADNRHALIAKFPTSISTRPSDRASST